MLNIQPVEKQNLSNPNLLNVHSIFLTIQGEAIFAGYRAVFIRLAGCNLQCPNCDTDYTSTVTQLSPSEITSIVDNLWNPNPETSAKGVPLVVITGGEPFRQNLSKLIPELQNRGFTVQIETNGTLFQENIFHNPEILNRMLKVVCSPKTGNVNPKLVPFIDAYKYVVRDNNICKDGLPVDALAHPVNPWVFRPPLGRNAKIYVQPEDSKDPEINAANVQAAVKSSLEHGYILCLQLHKLVNLD